VKQFALSPWILTAASIGLFVAAVAVNGKMLQRRLRTQHIAHVTAG